MSERPWVAPGSPPPDQGQGGATSPPPPPSAQHAAPSWAPHPPARAAYPAAPPPQLARPEFRPGIIPLRPLTLGDLYGAVVKAIRGNVGATMGLALLTSVVCLVPTTALGAWVASQEPATLDTEEFGVYGLAGTYLPALGSLISTVALTGFLAYVIGQAVLGRKVGIGETWDGTKRRLPAVAGAVLVTVVGGILLVLLMLGLPILLLIRDGAGVATVLLLVLAVLLAVVVYLWLWTRLAFVTAVIVLEGRGVAAAFVRSWRLTSGRPFWRILGIRFLTAAVVGVAANVITLPITLIGIVAVIALGGEDRLFMWQAILTGLATLVSGAITTPFSAGIDALMTVDQRIRREGLDVQLIHAAQSGGTAPWPSAAAAR